MGLFYLSATPECQDLPQDLALGRIHQMGKWSSERTVPCTLLLWHLPRFKSPHPGDPRCRLTHKPLFRHRLRLSLSSQGLWALHSLLVSSLENFVQCVLIIPSPHTHTTPSRSTPQFPTHPPCVFFFSFLFYGGLMKPYLRPAETSTLGPCQSCCFETNDDRLGVLVSAFFTVTRQLEDSSGVS